MVSPRRPPGSLTVVASRRGRIHLLWRPTRESTAVGPAGSPAGLESHLCPLTSGSWDSRRGSQPHDSLGVRRVQLFEFKAISPWRSQVLGRLGEPTSSAPNQHCLWTAKPLMLSQPPSQISSSFVVPSLRDPNVLQSGPRLEDHIPQILYVFHTQREGERV